MITDKGIFVLDCLRQGLNLPLKEYDALWEQVSSSTTYRNCDKCNGTGKVKISIDNIEKEISNE